ncbi:MAG TPA: hypothetical protein VFI28_02850, partial [Candidatus Limnocylindrales bacterium]|nr:hypothetical protein [Candidatus Limnocylindrales bacterium]
MSVGRGLGSNGITTTLALLALVLDAAALVLLLMSIRAGVPVDAGTNTTGGFVLGAAFPAVGWLIARRRPENAIGWIFLAVGLSQSLDAFAGQYSTYGLSLPAALPLAVELSWVAVWAWAPGYVLLLTLSILLFPDGRVPSPRWRAVAWLAWISLVLLIVPVAIAAWPARGIELIGSGPPGGLGLATDLEGLGLVLAAIAAVGSVAALVSRFRRSVGIERQQLKWFTFFGGLEVILVSTSAALPLDAIAGAVLAIMVTPLLPLATAAAILRYRLFDIDRIVSRTIGYAVVTGLLVGVFVTVVLAVQAVLDPFVQRVTDAGTLAVAASTLAVFALFQPLRRRIQRLVDRRFDRARVDADR